MRTILMSIVMFGIVLSLSVSWADDTGPRGLRAVVADGVVYLHWSPQKGVEGYWVYRAFPGGNYQRMNQSPLKQAFYGDRNVVNGQFYWYVVTAIDQKGNESAQSKEIAAKPTPQHGPLIGY